MISAFAAAIACGASADIIYETSDPFGGPFGLIGFDVCADQSVALRFEPAQKFRLDRVSLWYMSNDFDGTIHPQVTVTLREDLAEGKSSIPSEIVIESWTFAVSAVGWAPVLEHLDSLVHPTLEGGQRYWIVCESDEVCGLDGVWNWAAADSGFMSIFNCPPGSEPCQWNSGDGAVAATVIEGTPVIFADLDHDGSVGTGDLAQLLSQWGACQSPPPQACPADLNHDGSVGPADLAQLLANWT